MAFGTNLARKEAKYLSYARLKRVLDQAGMSYEEFEKINKTLPNISYKVRFDEISAKEAFEKISDFIFEITSAEMVKKTKKASTTNMYSCYGKYMVCLLQQPEVRKVLEKITK